MSSTDGFATDITTMRRTPSVLLTFSFYMGRTLSNAMLDLELQGTWTRLPSSAVSTLSSSRKLKRMLDSETKVSNASPAAPSSRWPLSESPHVYLRSVMSAESSSRSSRMAGRLRSLMTGSFRNPMGKARLEHLLPVNFIKEVIKGEDAKMEYSRVKPTMEELLPSPSQPVIGLASVTVKPTRILSASILEDRHEWSNRRVDGAMDPNKRGRNRNQNVWLGKIFCAEQSLKTTVRSSKYLVFGTTSPMYGLLKQQSHRCLKNKRSSTARSRNIGCQQSPVV